uniref:Uncharacterized protein n=1 Tax=Arundo donax TaxID=35708 RepID=A0A0A9B568_ARUDO
MAIGTPSPGRSCCTSLGHIKLASIQRILNLVELCDSNVPRGQARHLPVFLTSY